MTDPSPRLTALGDALQGAARADLGHARRGARVRGRLTRRPVLLSVALAIAVPAAAVAGTQLLSSGDVARSLPAGTLALLGTDPTCTVVQDGVEYHCTLGKAPSQEGAPAPGDWNGTVEPTVDQTSHVNGGCRSLSDDGRTWECYVGQTAVDQKIIGQGFLGQAVQGPGVG